MNEIKVREKKGEKDCESKTEVRGKMERFSERERERKKEKEEICSCPSRVFFHPIPSSRNIADNYQL